MSDERIDSRNAISDYIFYSKYSRTLTNGEKETWAESVSRVMQMHFDFFEKKVDPQKKTAFLKEFYKIWQYYNSKAILGSQRALQYGGEQLLKNHFRLYNCAASFCNRVEFFEECMEILLSGSGTGFSVQKCHIEQLPIMKGIDRSRKVVLQIPDSIEGWSRSVGELIESYYYGLPEVEFDYSLIREKGSFISGGFKAPGPDPLRECHEKIKSILDKVDNRKLRPFECHWITCINANAVVSGGVRRSAMVSIFDIDDKEMMTCKTGNWFMTHPDLCRCNNSAVILPDTPKEKYNNLFKSIKDFGEPGLYFCEDTQTVPNPCVETAFNPFIEVDGKIEYGWGICNLTEINGSLVKTEEDFYEACEMAAMLGTMQAAYTDFPVVSRFTKMIVERDALIGVGITGMADSPEILFNETIQRRGATIVKEANALMADLLGINSAARTTVIKPSGNSSQLLGCAPGIHAYHFRKYIRNIQASNIEQGVKEQEKINPNIISSSFWNPGREKVLSFPIELPKEAMVREDFSTIDFLKRIYLTKRNWIEYGTNFHHPSQKENPNTRFNVSCTVSVKDDEWDEVRDWIWKNKEGFAGLSFLPESGDLQYPQAPYTSYLNEKELVDTYGTGAILSSGLIVDALTLFSDIWTACKTAHGENKQLLSLDKEDVIDFIQKNMTADNKLLVKVDGVYISDVNAIISYLQHEVDERVDWVRRFDSFAIRFFDGNKEKCANCLKHVNIFHQWHKVKDMKEIDWNTVKWEQELQDAGATVATACAGGACSI